MNGFFLACAAVTAIPMAVHRDPAGAAMLAINPIFWTICARFA